MQIFFSIAQLSIFFVFSFDDVIISQRDYLLVVHIVLAMIPAPDRHVIPTE